MKAVILAGGYGTRISEESAVRPKPMVEIGNKPILWHIMKIFSTYGIHEFIICCGYKGHLIKQYFANYFLHRADITFNLRNNSMDILQNDVEPWKVSLIDTGENTMTGGRLKRIEKYLGPETFCMTYGDGVSDVRIDKLIEFHLIQGTLATLTAVQPPGRFGAFNLSSGQNLVPFFKEKPKGDGAWINGGFFVLEPEVLNYIDGDATVWEQEPMEKLAQDGNMSAYRHHGFWQPMDTLRDKNVLESLWISGNATWKVW
jgi:glucose-1-phosphate cytidylyltransferase